MTLPAVSERVRRLGTRHARLVGWLAPIGVALLALALRLYRLGYPNRLMFDETYYPKDAYSLRRFGYVQDFVSDANAKIVAGDLTGLFTGQPTQIVHPDGGKWMLALGQYLFGMDSFGWRFSAAVVGALTVLVLARMVRRLTGSTLLGCVGGLLLTFDGTHFVMSRIGLLDVFLAFWLVCAVACLVADRDWGRARLVARAEAAGGVVRGFGPRLLWRPWRVAAGLSFGMALGTKWSALYVLAAFGLLTWAWDAANRRAIGVRAAWVRSALVDAAPALVSLVLVAAVVYLATWTGWLIHHGVYETRFGNGYGDNAPWGSYVTRPASGWLQQTTDAFRSLWHFHVMVYDFHTGDYLAGKTHPYQSSPRGWLLLNRPVGVDVVNDIQPGVDGCRAVAGDTCLRQVTVLGNPAVWWPGAAALVASVWLWARRGDWRFAVPLLAVAATVLPWFQYDDRPIFSFYAVATVPFTIVATCLVIGAMRGSGPASALRSRLVVVGVGVYLAVVICTFAWFYPILTDQLITRSDWADRMWFRRWI